MSQSHKQSQAKRKRSYGWIPIMTSPFPDDIKINQHHINNLFVIPIPDKFHNGGGKNHRKQMEKIIMTLYSISIKSLLTGEWTS